MCKTVQSESSTSSSTNTYTSKDNSNKSRSCLETKLKILNQTKTSDELLAERQDSKPKGAWAKLFDCLFRNSKTTFEPTLESQIADANKDGVKELLGPLDYKDCGGGGQDFGYPDKYPDKYPAIPTNSKTHLDTVDDYMFGDFLKFSTNPSYHYSCDVIAKVRKEHRGKGISQYYALMNAFEYVEKFKYPSRYPAATKSIKINDMLPTDKAIFIARLVAWIASDAGLINQIILVSRVDKKVSIMCSEYGMFNQFYTSLTKTDHSKYPYILQKSGHLKPWGLNALNNRYQVPLKSF